MIDPLSQVVRLLRPQAVFANIVSGRGSWAVHYSRFGQPSFCIMLEGSCKLQVEGNKPITISAGDFVLLPSTPAFTISSFEPAPPIYIDPDKVAGGVTELRYGEQEGEADMRSLGGSFQFDSTEPELLISLLPEVIHVQHSMRLKQLVQMVSDEVSGQKPGSEFMLSRFVELMLVESMRSIATGNAPAGLLLGLSDDRLAAALKQMHMHINRSWTVIELAKIAALSRSSFFDRFTRLMGMAPMEYLLAWRMEIAKDLLREKKLTVAEIAERVGYSSSSTFSTAFSRHVELSPTHYAQLISRT